MANYIDADEFLSEVILSRKENRCTDRLGELLVVLHDHILTRDRFLKKPCHIKQEIKSYSLFRILKRGILTFDPDSTARSCFNYFTTACITNMTRRLQTIDDYEKKYTEVTPEIIERYFSKRNRN